MPNINLLDGSLEEYSPIAVTGIPLKIEVPNESHSRAELMAASETLYRGQGFHGNSGQARHYQITNS